MRRRGIILVFCLAAIALLGCQKGKEGAREKGTDEASKAPVVSTSRETSSGDLAAPSEGTREKAPRIVFDHTEYDFGEVDAGETVEHLFPFRNTGDAPLRIEKVRSG